LTVGQRGHGAGLHIIHPPPFAPGDSSASPGIAALRKQVEARTTTSVAQFWTEIARNHAPLVEPNPADDRSSLLTFVWQAKEPTRNVIVVGGVTGIDLAANQMTRLGLVQKTSLSAN
jgi:hypothetical protein